MRRPNGGNHGVSTDDILSKLREWQTRCQLTVFGAASDWIAIEFQTLPDSICRFAEEVYGFCPDSVEQGVGLMDERTSPQVFEAARELCPELSPAMQARLKEQEARFAAMDIPADLRKAFNEGKGFSTSTDMGIRLLAFEISRSRKLFLWWD